MKVSFVRKSQPVDLEGNVSPLLGITGAGLLYLQRGKKRETALESIYPGFDFLLLHILTMWQWTAELTDFLICKMGSRSRLQCKESTCHSLYSAWSTVGTLELWVCLNTGKSQTWCGAKYAHGQSTYYMLVHLNEVPKRAKLIDGKRKKFLRVVTTEGMGIDRGGAPGKILEHLKCSIFSSRWYTHI